MAENGEAGVTVSVSDVLIHSKPTEAEISAEKRSEVVKQDEPTSADDKDLAPADKFWTTDRDGAVKIRVGITEHDNVKPITVHELFKNTVERAGDSVAFAVKRNDQWQKWTYSQYMEDCKTAAKGFIKVINSY